MHVLTIKRIRSRYQFALQYPLINNVPRKFDLQNFRDELIFIEMNIAGDVIFNEIYVTTINC